MTRRPHNGGQQRSLNERQFRAATFPKVEVHRTGDEDDEDDWQCFKHASPTGGSSLRRGTLEECTEAAVASGLPWTDVKLGRRRLPPVEEDDGG